MPKLYEYLGIIIRFYSDEHEPIHVHALYAGCELKISFMVKDGMVKRITYTAIIGKFPRSKLDALKQFISLKKRDIVQAWCDYFVYHREISCVKITEKRSKIAEKRSKS